MIATSSCEVDSGVTPCPIDEEDLEDGEIPDDEEDTQASQPDNTISEVPPEGSDESPNKHNDSNQSKKNSPSQHHEGSHSHRRRSHRERDGEDGDRSKRKKHRKRKKEDEKAADTPEQPVRKIPSLMDGLLPNPLLALPVINQQPRSEQPPKKKRNYFDYDRMNDEEVVFIRGESPPTFTPMGERVSPMFKRDGRMLRSPGPYDSPYHSYDSEMEMDGGLVLMEEHWDEMGENHSKRGKSRLDGRRGGRKDRARGGKRRVGPEKSETTCHFFLQGKCHRGPKCPYSHDISFSKKMELCKFYMMDCCAKKENCLYMHKEFPCKFFHTGMKCKDSAESCKFSHMPLSDVTRPILIKHLETAPKEILGNFPRLSREGAYLLVDTMESKSNPQSHKSRIGMDQRSQRRDYLKKNLQMSDLPPEVLEQLRYSPSSHDRSPTPTPSSPSQSPTPPNSGSRKRKSDFNPRDNNRHVSPNIMNQHVSPSMLSKTEDAKKGNENDHNKKDGDATVINDEENEDLIHLPKRQRELYKRIQQQQRVAETNQNADGDSDDALNKAGEGEEDWYSSDEEGENKSLSDVLKTITKQSRPDRMVSPDSSTNTRGGGGVLGVDLSKVDIPDNVADVLRMLKMRNEPVDHNSPEQTIKEKKAPSSTPKSSRDPRISHRDPRQRLDTSDDSPNQPTSNHRDPRATAFNRNQLGDIDLRQPHPDPPRDTDLRNSMGDIDLRATPAPALMDIDLRQLATKSIGTLPLPFKPVPNHDAATEIDASITSHPPMLYKLKVMIIAKPNYAAIRSSDQMMQNDPRLMVGGTKTSRRTSRDSDPGLSSTARPDLRARRESRDSDREPSRSYTPPLPANQNVEPRGLPALLGLSPPGFPVHAGRRP